MHAAEHLEAGLARTVAPGLGVEQLIHADIEGQREAHGHLGRQAQVVALVIRNRRLGNPELLGELDLGDAALLANAGEALAQGLV